MDIFEAIRARHSVRQYLDKPIPAWFRRGMEYALLAPTAINQQKFRFTLEPGGAVRAEALKGPFSKVDLGIVKYHFAEGAGAETFTWAK